LVLLGTVALVWAHADVHSATYKGSKLCINCHKLRPNQKAMVEGYVKTAHANAMKKADEAGAIVADFANAPLGKDQVAYVLASGRTTQAYLDADFKVLSHRWNATEKKWEPEPDAGADATAQCLGCHTTGYDPAKKEFTQMGVGCEMCHGPGSDHQGAPLKTKDEDLDQLIVRPQKLDAGVQAMICGQCHSLGKDKSGNHAFPMGYRPTDMLFDFFDDAKPTEPGRNRQYSEMLQGKHLAAGTICTTCHEPHGDTQEPHQLRKPITELCLDCHADTIKDIATHAADKQVQAPEGATCATCHMPDGRHVFSKEAVVRP